MLLWKDGSAGITSTLGRCDEECVVVDDEEGILSDQ